MRKLLCAALLFVASTAGAFEPGDIEKAEGTLSRLALERAAFVACAEDAALKGHLTDSWAQDMKAVGETLQQRAFPGEFVAKLATRFDVEAAVPSFASEKDRESFCAVLGDWQRRWELFYVPSPVGEIERVLQP